MESIHGLLGSDGCRLRELEVFTYFPARGLNVVQRFVQDDLPQNTSLEHLSFAGEKFLTRGPGYVSENDIILLLRSLWKLPSLRSLDLPGISDFVSIATNLAGAPMLAPHGLRSLNIDTRINLGGRAPNQAQQSNRFIPWKEALEAKRATMQHNDERSRILRLLEDVFPELCYLGEEFAQAVQSGILPSSVGLQLVPRALVTWWWCNPSSFGMAFGHGQGE